jgi:hypothetical protein
MFATVTRIRRTHDLRAAERRYQRYWDRAVAHAGSDSHLDEINAIFAERCS